MHRNVFCATFLQKCTRKCGETVTAPVLKTFTPNTNRFHLWMFVNGKWFVCGMQVVRIVWFYIWSIFPLQQKDLKLFPV